MKSVCEPSEVQRLNELEERYSAVESKSQHTVANLVFAYLLPTVTSGTSFEISFASFCNIVVVSQRYTHSHSGQIDPVICSAKTSKYVEMYKSYYRVSHIRE